MTSSNQGSVLKERKQHTLFVDVCSDCFGLIVQLKKINDYGDPELLRQRIQTLLDRIESQLKKEGNSDEDIQLVIFALVAFLDETIIISQWDQKEVWLCKPLQMQLYDRFDAGDEFFNKLEKIRQRSGQYKHILEVYYLCMALGFKGKYQMEDREKFQKIFEAVYADIRYFQPVVSEILSVHGQRKEELHDIIVKEVPLWVIIITAMTVGLCFYVIMSLLINNAESTVLDRVKGLLTSY